MDAEPQDERLEALDRAIGLLEGVDARAAEVVMLKTFLGLSESHIAQSLGVSERTVRRDWAFAKTWLEAEMARSGRGAERSGG